jgi:hypothetical protein
VDDQALQKLVSGLSKAQLRALGQARYGRDGWRVPKASKSLHALGLTKARGSSAMTPQGMAARHLAEEMALI